MTSPFIFVTTNKIQDGKVDEYKAFLNELVKLVESQEPRMIAFYAYFDEESQKVTGIQVHPDADSMVLHMQVIGDKIREAMSYLQPDKVEVYGTPNEMVLQMIEQMSGSGVPISVYSDHAVGFIRSSATP